MSQTLITAFFSGCTTLPIKKAKGSQCSVSGTLYEKKVHAIVKRTIINGFRFNTQCITELGGSSDSIDLKCNYRSLRDIGIEIKKARAPDWVQCCIGYDDGWHIGNSRLTNDCQTIFSQYLGEITMAPLPLVKTYKEWTTIKSETTLWDDQYIDIPSDTIRLLYRSKGCQYIQISDYGLYHLGDDICNFGVNKFVCAQQIRVRVKVHSSRDPPKLSVTMACKPMKIANLPKSLFSLDDINRLPPGLSIER